MFAATAAVAISNEGMARYSALAEVLTGRRFKRGEPSHRKSRTRYPPLGVHRTGRKRIAHPGTNGRPFARCKSHFGRLLPFAFNWAKMMPLIVMDAIKIIN